MEDALSPLSDSRASLRRATANTGGYRATGMNLTTQAIEETQAGIEHADERAAAGICGRAGLRSRLTAHHFSPKGRISCSNTQALRG